MTSVIMMLLGVPLTEHVAGIACGLYVDDTEGEISNSVILTDMLGLEVRM